MLTVCCSALPLGGLGLPLTTGTAKDVLAIWSQGRLGHSVAASRLALVVTQPGSSNRSAHVVGLTAAGWTGSPSTKVQASSEFRGGTAGDLASGRFGAAVAMTADSSVVAVGAPGCSAPLVTEHDAGCVVLFASTQSGSQSEPGASYTRAGIVGAGEVRWGEGASLGESVALWQDERSGSVVLAAGAPQDLCGSARSQGSIGVAVIEQAEAGGLRMTREARFVWPGSDTSSEARRLGAAVAVVSFNETSSSNARVVVLAGAPSDSSGKGAVLMLELSSDNGTSWGLDHPRMVVLRPPTEVFRVLNFGLSIAAAHDTFAVAGGEANTLGVTTAGWVWLFRLSVTLAAAQGWSVGLEQRLDPSDEALGLGQAGRASFGYSLAMATRTLLVGAPLEGWGTAPERGAAILWQRSNTSSLFAPTRRIVHPPLGQDSEGSLAGDRFGMSVAVTNEMAVVGAPFAFGQYGRATVYDHPSAFPATAPAFVPPSRPIWTEREAPIEVHAPHLRDRVHAALAPAMPSVTDAYLVGLSRPGMAGALPPGAGGGIAHLPRPGSHWELHELRAFAASIEYPGVPGDIGTALYNVSVPTLGLMWDANTETLVQCGNVTVYCPGTFRPFDRLLVSDAHYTGPTSAPPDVRWNQSLCEDDWFCIGGERLSCGRPKCFPQVANASAREATEGETGPAGEDFFAMRAPGPSPGDVLELWFDTPTSRPQLPLQLSAWLNSTLDARLPGGSQGSTDDLAPDWTSAWISPWHLKVTLLGPGNETASPSAAPRPTRDVLPGVLRLGLLAGGDVRRVDRSTRPATQPAEVLLQGSWGQYDAPDVAAATAVAASEIGKFATDNGLGPSAGDVLRVEFSTPPDTSFDVGSPARVRGLLDASFWGNVSLLGAAWSQEPCAVLTLQQPGSCHESLMLRFDSIPSSSFTWGLDVSAMEDEVMQDPWASPGMLVASPFAGWVSLRSNQLRAADRASPPRAEGGARVRIGGHWGMMPRGVSVTRGEGDCMYVHAALPHGLGNESSAAGIQCQVTSTAEDPSHTIRRAFVLSRTSSPGAALPEAKAALSALDAAADNLASLVWATGNCSGACIAYNLTAPTLPPQDADSVATFKLAERQARICGWHPRSSVFARCRVSRASDEQGAPGSLRSATPEAGAWVRAAPSAGLAMGSVASLGTVGHSSLLASDGSSADLPGRQVRFRLWKAAGAGRFARRTHVAGSLERWREPRAQVHSIPLRCGLLQLGNEIACSAGSGAGAMWSPNITLLGKRLLDYGCLPASSSEWTSQTTQDVLQAAIAAQPLASSGLAQRECNTTTLSYWPPTVSAAFAAGSSWASVLASAGPNALDALQRLAGRAEQAPAAGQASDIAPALRTVRSLWETLLPAPLNTSAQEAAFSAQGVALGAAVAWEPSVAHSATNSGVPLDFRNSTLLLGSGLRASAEVEAWSPSSGPDGEGVNATCIEVMQDHALACSVVAEAAPGEADELQWRVCDMGQCSTDRQPTSRARPRIAGVYAASVADVRNVLSAGGLACFDAHIASETPSLAAEALRCVQAEGPASALLLAASSSSGLRAEAGMQLVLVVGEALGGGTLAGGTVRVAPVLQEGLQAVASAAARTAPLCIGEPRSQSLLCLGGGIPHGGLLAWTVARSGSPSKWSRAFVTETLATLPPRLSAELTAATAGEDVFSAPAESQRLEPARLRSRSGLAGRHADTSKLHSLSYVVQPPASTVVTTCAPLAPASLMSADFRKLQLAVGPSAPALSVDDALAAAHSPLGPLGYARPRASGGGFVDYQGGGVYFVLSPLRADGSTSGASGSLAHTTPDSLAAIEAGGAQTLERVEFGEWHASGAPPSGILADATAAAVAAGAVAGPGLVPDAVAIGEEAAVQIEQSGRPDCLAWVESLVQVPPTPHWVVFTAHGIPQPQQARPGAVLVRVFLDGVELPQEHVLWHSEGLVEVFLPGIVGRRRLHATVGTRVATGLVLVNMRPRIHGLAESLWIATMLGGSSAEALAEGELQQAQPGQTWGGLSAWDSVLACTRFGIVGAALPSQAHIVARMAAAFVGSAQVPCQQLSSGSSIAVECCTTETGGPVVVSLAGHMSAARAMDPSSDLLRAPVFSDNPDPMQIGTGAGQRVVLRGAGLAHPPGVPPQGQLGPGAAAVLALPLAPRNSSDFDAPRSCWIAAASAAVTPAAAFPRTEGAAAWGTEHSVGTHIESLYESSAGADAIAVVKTIVDAWGQAEGSAIPAALEVANSMMGGAIPATFWDRECTLHTQPLSPAIVHGALPNTAGAELLSATALPWSQGAATASFVPSALAPGAVGSTGLSVRLLLDGALFRGVTASSPVRLEYVDPTISSLAPALLPPGGGTVVIRGAGFGVSGQVYVQSPRRLLGAQLLPRAAQLPATAAYAASAASTARSLNWAGWYRVGSGLPLVQAENLAAASGATSQTDSAVVSRGLTDRALGSVQTCRVLHWDHEQVVCLAPAGIGSDSLLVVESDTSRVRAEARLRYQAVRPVLLNTTFSGEAVSISMPTFWEQSGLGFVMGAVLGLVGAGLALVAFWFASRHSIWRGADAAARTHPRPAVSAVELDEGGKLKTVSTAVTRQVHDRRANKLLGVEDASITQIAAQVVALDAKAAPGPRSSEATVPAGETHSLSRAPRHSVLTDAERRDMMRTGEYADDALARFLQARSLPAVLE